MGRAEAEVGNGRGSAPWPAHAFTKHRSTLRRDRTARRMGPALRRATVPPPLLETTRIERDVVRRGIVEIDELDRPCRVAGGIRVDVDHGPVRREARTHDLCPRIAGDDERPAVRRRYLASGLRLHDHETGCGACRSR